MIGLTFIVVRKVHSTVRTRRLIQARSASRSPTVLDGTNADPPIIVIVLVHLRVIIEHNCFFPNAAEPRKKLQRCFSGVESPDETMHVLERLYPAITRCSSPEVKTPQLHFSTIQTTCLVCWIPRCRFLQKFGTKRPSTWPPAHPDSSSSRAILEEATAST
ncbi:hypothetical protein M427DRAFT_57245 [Gonapodya prolifera JEL478]|uniref:Uncharacterized protein n=1 Tax=Gonapodya prolifera (strain JEL478) TaxID=1344416 RepID=A0A139AEJ2_GONPJ|nr:hypothetical protein M427DRAFT_57245 [Gonapodya prolifera JEL478]|eukprot:KXS14843.1 hypothetical protein M427DRAFT_57245 [Gonapodya prolifera JEL478]